MFKIDGDIENCTDCKACTLQCPMDIDIPEYIKAGVRVLSTECIICQTCMTVCPEKNLTMTFKLDVGGKEELRRREGQNRKKMGADRQQQKNVIAMLKLRRAHEAHL